MIVGDTIGLGGCSWRVLEVRPDRVLVLSDPIVGQRDYHDRKGPVTWESSEVRRYLNSDFAERFSPSEGERILPVENPNPGNPWYGTAGGPPTLDRVFLLSLDEVVRRYFGDSSRLLDQPKPGQRYWFDRKDGNNVRRRALFLDSPWWWWTRTPGKNLGVAVYVHGDGNIGIQGNGTAKTSFNTLHPVTQSNRGGLRPALWLRRLP